MFGGWATTCQGSTAANLVASGLRRAGLGRRVDAMASDGRARGQCWPGRLRLRLARCGCKAGDVRCTRIYARPWALDASEEFEPKSSLEPCLGAELR